MAIVMAACLPIVTDISVKICFHQFLNISAAATDNLYPLSLEHILRTLSHISGQHYSHSHLLKDRCNAALASATIR